MLLDLVKCTGSLIKLWDNLPLKCLFKQKVGETTPNKLATIHSYTIHNAIVLSIYEWPILLFEICGQPMYIYMGDSMTSGTDIRKRLTSANVLH